jgi:replicative DNA helicase
MGLSNLNKDRKPRRKPNIDLSTMVYGKVPPQAKELEAAVLGCITLARGANENPFDIVVEILQPEHFYFEPHQRIFRAMVALYRKSHPIDILTLMEQLKSTDELEQVGGAFALTKLEDRVVSTAGIENHCRIILEKFMKREMIRISGESISSAYDDTVDTFDMLDTHEQQFTSLRTGTIKNDFVSNDTAVVRAIQRIEELRSQPSHITGIPSGFDSLDRITHGWQNGDLIILAARPSVGKTAFALHLARSAAMARKKTAVAFFSLEMSIGQVTNRNISAISGIWLDLIVSGRLDNEQSKHLITSTHEMSGIPIHWDDTAAMTIFELRAKCRRVKRKHDVGLIIVDYLQLMSGVNERSLNREQEVEQISRGLKQIAKELNIPIIALSQLSRAVENRTGSTKMPQLSDLRNSGAIEQDADLVMFMYRPEYYDINSNENGETTKGETHVRIAKHRNGSLETIKLRAMLHIQKFVEWEGESFYKPGSLPAGNWTLVKQDEDEDDDNPF